MPEPMEKESPLTDKEFERYWSREAFKEVVREAATGEDSLRYRRILMEGRVAAIQLDMARWMKWAVFAAIASSTVSGAIAVIAILAD